MDIVYYIIKEYKRKNLIDLSQDQQALFRITEASEKILEELQTSEKAELNLPFIYAVESGPLHLNMTIQKEWNESSKPDTNELIFQKHKNQKNKKPNQGIIFIILTILIVVFSALLIFLMM